ncbi:MAG TPA: GNAT family N-acetyltransferase [Actinomycetota bacterium]
MAVSRPTEQVARLRPATEGDREFLVRVYWSTRSEELALTCWPQAETDEFVRMQFDLQDRHYRTAFPDAERSIVEIDGHPVGRLYVQRVDREIRILDIALLPRFRRRGIGGGLLADLVDEGSRSGRPVRIHVEARNPAISLYKRLGFVRVADEGVYHLMERPA